MTNKFVKSKKNGLGNEDSLDSLSEDKELSGEVKYRSKSERIIRWVNPEQALILSVKHSQIGKSGGKHPFFKSTHGLDYMIPKRVISLDEKYLRRCLELIHFRASRAARCNASVNVSSAKMSFVSESLSPEMRSGNSFDSAGLVFACPVIAGAENMVLSPTGELILGTIMGSKSMLNILKSPLLQQYGALDSSAKLKNVNSIDVNDSICYDYMESPSVLSLSLSSPLNLDKGTPTRERCIDGSDTSQKRLVSSSSTNSACSDQTSSSASATINQGMLQCTWKGGNPHFVFSMDDHKDVYVANLWKVESKGDKALDYIYSFHSGKVGPKEHEICDSHSHVVGKMKVSSSFTLGPSNSKIMETEFVLYGGNEHFITDLQTSSHNLRKSRAFSRKMSEVFKSSIPSKHKTVSKYGGSCAILEDCSLESSLDRGENRESAEGSTKLEDLPPPNFELAAVIVKDLIANSQKEETGGWGLKFLKKVGVKQTAKSVEASSIPFEGFRNNDDCSTSMDVLIPAGLHGGPRTRNGGPSSLTERWRSGGHCDCGGWDTGCPLKILKPGSSNNEALPHTQGECKSFDLSIQGSQFSFPTLRIVNVQDDLHFIQFQRTLSILQSFSIAVAIIHSRSPTLRPKDVHELK